MPKPLPDRQNFLNYLRCEFAYQMDFQTLQGPTVAYEAIHAGIKQVRDLDFEIYRVLWLHMFTRLPREKMVELTYFDESTIKRRLNVAASMIAMASGFSLNNPDEGVPQPSRENIFARNHFTAYLEKEFRKGQDYTDLMGVTFKHRHVAATLDRLKENDPILSKMMFYHTRAELPMTQIAATVNADPSTVKRKTNYAADLIMQRLRHSPDLDPVTGVIAFYDPARLGVV